VAYKAVDEPAADVAGGEVGELIVRGSNVMKGCCNMPEETAVALRDGWLHPGDMAWMDAEGSLYIAPRQDDATLVGGYNGSRREVEEVLFAHPAVTEVAVIGVPDPETGEAVIAFVVLKDSMTVSQQELSQFAEGHLAKYKIPSRIEFLDELPK